MLAAASTAQSAQIQSLVTRPIAPRGGMLMLPLVLAEGAAVRPRAMTLSDDAGRQLQAHLVWVQWGAGGFVEEFWTSDPRGLTVTLAQEGDTARPDRSLFLLAPMADNGRGDLHLNGQRLRPIWRDLPNTDLAARAGRLTLAASAARPDPKSPFEYWRWIVLADELGAEPPDAAEYGPAGAMIAEHFANVWSISLARLDAHSPAASQLLRGALTRICMDEQNAFAAWPADPGALSQLLGLLLDFDRPHEAIAAEVRYWVEAQQMPLLWVEAETDTHVQLALVNPASEPVVARFTWTNLPPQAARNEIPIAEQLAEGRLTRIRLERPRTAMDDQPLQLQVQVGERIEQLTFAARSIEVHPPGLTLPPLQPSLTLARVQADQLATVQSDRATVVQLRKRAGRWEVFFECLRPSGPANESRDRPLNPEHTRGREGVSLFIGLDDRGDSKVQLFIPESGWHQLMRGENDGTLQVHRRSYADRWHCRVVVPDVWLDALLEDDVTVFGTVRTHGDSTAVEYGPLPGPPWRVVPGRIALNLTQWVDLPGAAGIRR